MKYCACGSAIPEGWSSCGRLDCENQMPQKEKYYEFVVGGICQVTKQTTLTVSLKQLRNPEYLAQLEKLYPAVDFRQVLLPQDGKDEESQQ